MRTVTRHDAEHSSIAKRGFLLGLIVDDQINFTRSIVKRTPRKVMMGEE